MAEAIFDSLANGKATANSAGVDHGSYEGKRIAAVGPNVAMCIKDRKIGCI
jgi:hypothetical protein